MPAMIFSPSTRGSAADRLAHDDCRAAEVPHEGDQVPCDVGTAIAGPTEARFTASSDIDIGDAVTPRRPEPGQRIGTSAGCRPFRAPGRQGDPSPVGS